MYSMFEAKYAFCAALVLTKIDNLIQNNYGWFLLPRSSQTIHGRSLRLKLLISKIAS